MPEVPDTVDDALNALSSPSTDDVFDATRGFSSREIGSSAASRAIGGNGGSQPGDLARAEYFNTVAFLPPLDGSWAPVPWSANPDNPAAPLDLTDPTKPLVIVDGIYSVAATVQYDSGGTNKLARVELQLDADGFDWLLDATISADNLIESGQTSLGMTVFLAAGQAIVLKVQQFDDATPFQPNVQWYAAVQRVV